MPPATPCSTRNDDDGDDDDEVALRNPSTMMNRSPFRSYSTETLNLFGTGNDGLIPSKWIEATKTEAVYRSGTIGGEGRKERGGEGGEHLFTITGELSHTFAFQSRLVLRTVAR